MANESVQYVRLDKTILILIILHWSKLTQSKYKISQITVCWNKITVRFYFCYISKYEKILKINIGVKKDNFKHLKNHKHEKI